MLPEQTEILRATAERHYLYFHLSQSPVFSYKAYPDEFFDRFKIWQKIEEPMYEKYQLANLLYQMFLCSVQPTTIVKQHDSLEPPQVKVKNKNKNKETEKKNLETLTYGEQWKEAEVRYRACFAVFLCWFWHGSNVRQCVLK